MLDLEHYAKGEAMRTDDIFTPEEKKHIAAAIKYADEHPGDTIPASEVHAMTADRLKTITEMQFA
jgi:hypothetical protein